MLFYLRTEAVCLEARRDGCVVAAVEGVCVAVVVGGGEGELEALVVELVAPEEDPVGPRRAPPERDRDLSLQNHELKTIFWFEP